MPHADELVPGRARVRVHRDEIAWIQAETAGLARVVARELGTHDFDAIRNSATDEESARFAWIVAARPLLETHALGERKQQNTRRSARLIAPRGARSVAIVAVHSREAHGASNFDPSAPGRQKSAV